MKLFKFKYLGNRFDVICGNTEEEALAEYVALGAIDHDSVDEIPRAKWKYHSMTIYNAPEDEFPSGEYKSNYEEQMEGVTSAQLIATTELP